MDTTSSKDAPFALGICLQSASIPPFAGKTTKGGLRQTSLSRTATFLGLAVYMYTGDAVTSGLLFKPSWNLGDFQLAMTDIFRVASDTDVVRVFSCFSCFGRDLTRLFLKYTATSSPKSIVLFYLLST